MGPCVLTKQAKYCNTSITMNRNTQVLSVSLPPEIYKQIEGLSKQERKTKSQLVRDMLVVYRRSFYEKEWPKIRKMGEEIKKKYDFKSEGELLDYIHGEA